MDIVLIIMGTVIIVLMFVLIAKNAGQSGGKDIGRSSTSSAGQSSQTSSSVRRVSLNVQNSVRSLGDILCLRTEELR